MKNLIALSVLSMSALFSHNIFAEAIKSPIQTQTQNFIPNPLKTQESQAPLSSSPNLMINNLTNNIDNVNKINLSQSTLDRIKQTKTFNIGYMDNMYPFNFTNKETGEHLGFGIEIAHHVAKNIKKTLKMPDLQVKYVNTTTQNRWDNFNKRSVDLYCAAVTNTEERQQKNANFSYNYFVSNVRMLVPVDSDIKNYSDLAGKRLGIPANSSTTDLILSKKSEWKFEEVPPVRFAEMFEKLKKNEVDAIVYDETSFMSMLFRNPDQQNKYKIVGDSLEKENFACAMQLNDTQFKQLVNKTLKDLMKSKKIIGIYDKWFTQPLPPSGNSVNFPMNTDTARLYAFPHDKAVGQK